MRRTTTRIATTLFLTAGAIGVSGGMAASAGNADIARARHLVIHQDASTFLLLNTDPNSLVGNEFIDEWSATEGGTPVGSAETVCQALHENPDHSAVFLCTATVNLHGGQLVLQASASLGPDGQQDFRMAVTGGTGTYASARGDATVHYVDNTTRTVMLRVLPVR